VRRPTTESLQWFGLFAAPLAWTVQLLAGFGVTIAACDGGRDLSLVSWQVAITVVTAAVAVAGQAAAFVAWRATRRPGAPPPEGRIHFFADAALLANTLFIVLILLGGIAAADYATCRQA
jgi:hypothetical protein